ncbi:MAG: adenylosuccinate synthetase, partial [Lachnospiraceae bacterium]|nr:adenylosuccinate synthetase [Lachnospiraceae bacterium]
MIMQTIRAVIGKGFGDEGKGLVTDFYCSKSPNALVIKHNGGAQAGHTVETGGKRFVFHQLSAGSFRNADTFWARTYYPDLYKLDEEINAFEAAGGICPKIYCDAKTNVTLISDILLNMIAETMRGKERHGSCGMGINECDLRTEAGFGITVNKILLSDASALIKQIEDIGKDYVKKRLEELRKEIGFSVNPE